jgi:hypothetical protein
MFGVKVGDDVTFMDNISITDILNVSCIENGIIHACYSGSGHKLKFDIDTGELIGGRGTPYPSRIVKTTQEHRDFLDKEKIVRDIQSVGVDYKCLMKMDTDTLKKLL